MPSGRSIGSSRKTSWYSAQAEVADQGLGDQEQGATIPRKTARDRKMGMTPTRRIGMTI